MQLTIERLDDLPFLAGILKESGLVETLDQSFPVHGSWSGPGYGKTAMGLLLYILSEGSHTLYKVEPWAQEREEALRWLLEDPGFEAKHLSDDRLGLLLERFHGEAYESFQKAHNEAVIKAYDLSGSRVARLDSTKAQSFCGANGLFGKAHPQVNKRPDLVSLKAMIVALDPLALPVSTLVVRGNRVDDRLYVPAVEKAWAEGLRREGMLYVGDTKLGSSANWGFIALSGNYYLSPLAKKQFGKADLDEALDWAEASGVDPTPFYGHGFEEGELPPSGQQPAAVCVELPAQSRQGESGMQWQHRLLAVCNLEMRRKQLIGLEQRCEQAIVQAREKFVVKQGRKRITTARQAEEAAARVLSQYKAEGLVEIKLLPPSEDGGQYRISCALDKHAYEMECRRAGWGVYATNAPREALSHYELLRIYRQQFRIEQQFHYLLNKCTALQPVFLKKPHRVEALVRFLALALQFVALIQHKTRENMRGQKIKYLDRLIPGNPGRKVGSPNTALLLKAFCPMELVMARAPDGTVSYMVKELNEIQKTIIRLAGLTPEIYQHPTCRLTTQNLTEM